MRGAFFALLAGGLLSPDAALAGCDHETWRRAASIAGSDHFELLTRAAVFPEAADDQAPKAPSPCSGKLCSGEPSPPAAPVAPSPLSTRAEEWVCRSEAPAASTPGFVAHSLPDDAALPSPIGPSIFHPPRPSPSPR